MGAVLDNKWVARAGNASFIVGVMLGVIRFVGPWGVTTVAIIVLLGLGVVLMAIPYAKRALRHATAQRSPSVSETQARSILREYATGSPRAEVVLFPSYRHGLARKLVGAFVEAGWRVDDLVPSAQESPLNPTEFVGVEVRGASPERVNAVAKALTLLGVDAVQARVEVTQIQPENPKYQMAIESIFVRIGLENE